MKPQIAAVATTITAMGETIRASTALWPTMSAPMRLTASPTGSGSRSPASIRSSNAMSIAITSNATENGTSCFAATMLSSSFSGIIS